MSKEKSLEVALATDGDSGDKEIHVEETTHRDERNVFQVRRICAGAGKLPIATFTMSMS